MSVTKSNSVTKIHKTSTKRDKKKYWDWAALLTQAASRDIDQKQHSPKVCLLQFTQEPKLPKIPLIQRLLMWTFKFESNLKVH